MKKWLKCRSYTESQNYLGWKRPLRSLRPAFDQSIPYQLDQSPECHVQFFLEHLHGQWFQPIPMSNHPLCEEILPKWSYMQRSDCAVRMCRSMGRFWSPGLHSVTGFKGLTWQICVTWPADLKFVGWHGLSYQFSVCQNNNCWPKFALHFFILCVKSGS